MISLLRLMTMAVVAFSEIAFGVLLIPFGKAGAYYRKFAPIQSKQLMAIAGAKVDIVGVDKLDPKQSYVFIGNHQSYADIFLIQKALGKNNIRTLFMVKKELFEIPLFGTVTKHMGLVPVDRGESRDALKAILMAVKTVQDGNNIVVFAEGTRTDDGTLSSFKRGGFILGERSKVPVVPFVITGTSYIIPKGTVKVNSGHCRIHFLDPIEPGLKSQELQEIVEKRISEVYYTEKEEMDKLWQK